MHQCVHAVLVFGLGHCWFFFCCFRFFSFSLSCAFLRLCFLLLHWTCDNLVVIIAAVPCQPLLPSGLFAISRLFFLFLFSRFAVLSLLQGFSMANNVSPSVFSSFLVRQSQAACNKDVGRTDTLSGSVRSALVLLCVRVHVVFLSMSIWRSPRKEM